MKQRAFALVRVSSSEQDTLSQKESLRKIANSFGYVLDDEDIFEEKISGYDEDESKDRDSIVQLEEQIKIQKPDAIFVWELSRLTRRAIKVQRYIDRLSVIPKIPMYFADYKIWTLNPETKKPNDKEIMQLVGGAKGVEIERDNIKARTSRGRDAKAEKGYFVGHLADGYTWEFQNGEKVIIKDTERAKLIEKIFRMYADNEYSQGMIRDVLNSDIDKYPPTNKYRRMHPVLFKGYKSEYVDRSHNPQSRENLKWTDSAVGQILRNEWYHGVRYYHGIQYKIPAIVDEDLWERVQNRLTSLQCIENPTRRKYLLTGRLYCGKCGRKLYGHGDGYSNLYYCSSKEYGRANICGLRWIRQENLDSIVFNVVKKRASEDIIYGEKTVFSDFFNTDDKKAKEINNEIKIHNSIISRSTEEIKKLNGKINFYIEQQGNYFNNPKIVEKYGNQITATEKEIKEQEKTILTHKIAIERLNKQKKLLVSFADKLSKVSAITDFDNMRSLLFSVLSRVVVYNPDKTTAVIVLEYVNGESDSVIYNTRRLLGRYIFLSEDYKKRMKIRYDNERKEIVFEGYYWAIGDSKEILFNEAEDSIVRLNYNDEFRITSSQWDTPFNRNKVQEQIQKGIAAGKISNEDIPKIKSLYDSAVEMGVIWKDINHAIQYLQEDGMTVYRDSISVLDFVNLKRTSQLNVYGYSDLLPMTEKGILRKNWHREYYKRYNTGNPLFSAFIEKDADYYQICKERKHLYNRKYKILHNKSLTEAQKEEKIMEIMKKLEAYKYHLKYLPTNKKGINHIKKYNSKQ